MWMSKVFVSMFLKQYLFILKRFSASSWNMFTFLECNATKREMNPYRHTQRSPKKKMTGYTEERLCWSVFQTADRQFMPVNAAFSNLV